MCWLLVLGCFLLIVLFYFILCVRILYSVFCFSGWLYTCYDSGVFVVVWIWCLVSEFVDIIVFVGVGLVGYGCVVWFCCVVRCAWSCGCSCLVL